MARIGLLSVLLALAGCALVPPEERDDGVDHAQVNAVERQAGQAGVRVYWMHMPRKINR